MSRLVEKPLRRAPLRRSLGRLFYSTKRTLDWWFGAHTFASTVSDDILPFLVKSHQSFLLRPLRDVDMQLQRNKITNLRLAIQHLHGLTIKPGEVFSLWYRVGKPTKEKGYLPGLVLNQGKIESGIGGGLCQLGNLLFWLAVHSPLRIKERHRHGYDVFPDVNRTLPFGSGATLAYNYIDFQLVNDTDKTFQLLLGLSEEYLKGEIRCSEESTVRYEVYESDHQIVHQPWGGYTRHNKLNRRIFDNSNGELSSDEFFLENHAIMMYEPLLTDGSNT